MQRREPKTMIISLDQNVISLLLENSSRVNPAWSKIKSLLIAGTSAGKIVCPIPYETAWESMPLSDYHYQQTKKLQTDLSLGFSFKSYIRLLGEELLALVRPDVNLSSFESGNWHNLCEHLRPSQNEFISAKKSAIEKMSAIPINYENKKLTFAELEKHIHKQDSFDLYNNLERLKTGQALAPTCACTTDISDFLKRNNISHDEIERLKQLVLHHKYEAIPIHFYYNRLVTQFEFDLLHGGRREEAGDMYDLPRTATALWGAQIYVCDAEMAEICRRTKISKLRTVPTIVISARQPELFLQHLESIPQISSPQ
jgi:hypothetical protein